MTSWFLLHFTLITSAFHDMPYGIGPCQEPAVGITRCRVWIYPNPKVLWPEDDFGPEPGDIVLDVWCVEGACEVYEALETPAPDLVCMNWGSDESDTGLPEHYEQS